MGGKRIVVGPASTITRAKVSKEGYEAQLMDESDRTIVMSISGR